MARSPLPARWLKRASRSRFGGLLLFLSVFLVVSGLLRLILTFKIAGEISWDSSLLAAFGWGLLFDCATAAWFAVPLILGLIVLPSSFLQGRFGRFTVVAASFVISCILVFAAVAEWFFWDEFTARLNFIAVDYLVYTSEVVANIVESYPMGVIFPAIAVAGGILTFLVWKSEPAQFWTRTEHEPWRRRLATGGLCLIGTVAFGMAVNLNWLPRFQNNYNREIAKNGIWSFFAAFRDNELDFDQFYQRIPVEESFAELRAELAEDGSILQAGPILDSLRDVVNPGPELRPNIIQITVESLSASFLGAFNPESKLTPELDALAQKSLVFDNAYATGTRTVRGMEALTLSLPPTPGRSIVKRPNNSGLFSLGSVLRGKGYDTAFLYSGYGYFDNMNRFFYGNGYRVIDLASVEKGEVTFSNAWGACDQDLYGWTLREADAANANERPFHFFVMTTSNHRPFTYPEGMIDLPSGVSKRPGAVKYTDFAIGEFLRKASTRPWYNNTIFVIVADHCGSVAGKTEVPVENYHIPLIIYAPGGQVKPGHVKTLTSQVDFAPTLLGLLNMSYKSRFFGHDVFKIDPADAHALLGNYQKLGHVEENELVVLAPKKEHFAYQVSDSGKMVESVEASDSGLRETIAYYESASYLYRNGLYLAVDPEDVEPAEAVRGKHVAAIGTPVAKSR